VSDTPPKGLAIGLLGGSFNPAHRGHLHISLAALERLDLDEVWWLVSPQNPLKSATDMAPFDERCASAQTHAADPRIKVSDFELNAGTTYTVDTLDALAKAHPEHKFVFLIGADILIEFHKWREWRQIFRRIPIAVFARPSFSSRALMSRAAKRFARHRLRERLARRLAWKRAPAWIFMAISLDTTSATKIRRHRL